jgi:hypothetical protein
MLYEDGLSLREVGARLGVSHVTVKRLLDGAGVPLRRGHLKAVPDLPSRPGSRPLHVSPEAVAIAFTADRGWHMVQAPPGWFLDLLAELD